MAPPSAPLPLTAANLAMLQARPATPAPNDGAVKAVPDQPRPAPPANSSGRGRLVDIVV